ncbi:MAG TPA: hypothetical protein VE619_08660 [Nitrososphaeraceae archaeon]|nr:hypothetical protein [Nitrososphaeraceae archaeon]
MSSSNNDQRAANNDDPLQTFSKTCSMMYSRINRKQFEYFQAMTQLQEDMLDSCNGLVKNQVDLIEEYSKKGIVTKEQMIPIIDTINRFIEGYLNYLSLEYDLVLSRMRLHHKILTMINDSSPKLTEIAIQSLKSFKSSKK